jgi:hypothetical protein
MKNIILQIVGKTTEKLMEYYEINGIHDLADMAEGFKSISEEMAREVLEVFISTADDAIRNAKAERMGDGIKIRESRVPRMIFTALGEFSYERTYYDTPYGREYILDSILGVGAYERIDSGISARLVNRAAIHSYGKSADIVTGGQISRQSVRNKVMNTGEVVYVPKRAAETPEILHIFADEDHVDLQDGKNTILPLVTVCGGKRRLSKGRNELIEAFHVQGYDIKPETLWEYVYALCAEKYDMEQVKQIYIYGDGAFWIARFTDVFPFAVHVLDGFHYKNRMKRLFSGEICSSYCLAAYGAVKRNDKAGFDRTIQSMLCEVEEKIPESKERTSRIKTVMDNAGYIMRHWEAVQNMSLPETIGSCTEAMVSHVLSARFSRHPMGWSKEGLSKMSMIRVYVVNGGRIEPGDTLAWKYNPNRYSVITEFEKYSEIVRKQQDEICKDAKNWRWLEVDSLISGKTTGTKVALDSLGITREVS